MKKNLTKKRNLIKKEEIDKSEIPAILIKCAKGMAYERNHNTKNLKKEVRA